MIPEDEEKFPDLEKSKQPQPLLRVGQYLEGDDPLQPQTAENLTHRTTKKRVNSNLVVRIFCGVEKVFVTAGHIVLVRYFIFQCQPFRRYPEGIPVFVPALLICEGSHIH